MATPTDGCSKCFSPLIPGGFFKSKCPKCDLPHEIRRIYVDLSEDKYGFRHMGVKPFMYTKATTIAVPYQNTGAFIDIQLLANPEKISVPCPCCKRNKCTLILGFDTCLYCAMFLGDYTIPGKQYK